MCDGSCSLHAKPVYVVARIEGKDIAKVILEPAINPSTRSDPNFLVNQNIHPNWNHDRDDQGHVTDAGKIRFWLSPTASKEKPAFTEVTDLTAEAKLDYPVDGNHADDAQTGEVARHIPYPSGGQYVVRKS